MTTYNSLDDVAKEFVRATSAETESLFIQGAVILDAANQGFDVDETCAYCGASVGRSKRTAYRRYATTRTFPKPYAAKTWEYHALAASIVDYRHSNNETILAQQVKAHDWLKKSITEQWGTRALRAAMKAAGENVTPDKVDVLLDNEPCTLQRIVPLYITHTHEAVFNLTEEQAEHLKDLPFGAQLKITVVKPLAEREAA